MTALGTILPTAAILAAGDRAAAEQAARDRRIGVIRFECQPATVGGELRWELPANKYATVRAGRILVFERRADGDFAIKAW